MSALWSKGHQSYMYISVDIAPKGCVCLGEGGGGVEHGTECGSTAVEQ